LNEKKFKSLLLENYDHDKKIYRLYAPQMRFRGWSHGSSKQIQDGGSLILKKNINNSALDKDISTKFHGKTRHGHAAMTT